MVATEKTFTYSPRYRPVGPNLFRMGARLIERGTGGCYPLRSDLPEGTRRFGVFELDRQLSADERERMEVDQV